MVFQKRMDEVFKKAFVLPLTCNSKYVLMSDCHRGDGSWGDNFLKNQVIFLTALQFYDKNCYTYVELGDGDELWENASLSQIVEVHTRVFQLLSKLYRENRFYMIYGNHDICKKRKKYTTQNCTHYYCESERCKKELLPNLQVYEGIILKDKENMCDIYLTHGHQADFLNYELWPLARFLVRFLWHPLELIGVRDPTSAAQNNRKKKAVEERLSKWANKEKKVLVTGHTHRPMFPEQGEQYYFNDGSCVHPKGITAIEIVKKRLTLVKWTYQTRKDGVVYIGKEVLAGPLAMEEFQEKVENYGKNGKE